MVASIGTIIIILIICFTAGLVYAMYRNKNSKICSLMTFVIILFHAGNTSSEQHIPTTDNVAYEDINKYNQLSTAINPAYGEIQHVTCM